MLDPAYTMAPVVIAAPPPPLRRNKKMGVAAPPLYDMQPIPTAEISMEKTVMGDDEDDDEVEDDDLGKTIFNN
jgi:hypothetical protein